jgi:hypothetical protein
MALCSVCKLDDISPGSWCIEHVADHFEFGLVVEANGAKAFVRVTKQNFRPASLMGHSELLVLQDCVLVPEISSLSSNHDGAQQIPTGTELRICEHGEYITVVVYKTADITLRDGKNFTRTSSNFYFYREWALLQKIHEGHLHEILRVKPNDLISPIALA